MTDIIIDTDIGGDIDDALALAMALHNKSLNILGITTVYAGNVWRRDLTMRMLSAFGRSDILVYMGAERPLLGDWGVKHPCENDAALFIANTARNAPVTLLSIGPMTNVALALSLAPGIARNLTIYAMGGMLSCAHPEWNVLCDPEAADIVLSSDANITLVPLDVTEKCTLTKDQALALVAGNGSEMAFLRGEMTRFFEQFSFLPTLHDPLALLCLFSPDLCGYARKDIRVETSGIHTRGVTVERRHIKDGRVRAAVTVDAQAAVSEILKMVRGDA